MKKLLVVLLSLGIVNSVFSVGFAGASEEDVSAGGGRSEYHFVKGSDGKLVRFPKGVSSTLDDMSQLSFFNNDDNTLELRDYESTHVQHIVNMLEDPLFQIKNLKNDVLTSLVEPLIFFDIKIPPVREVFLDKEFAVNGLYTLDNQDYGILSKLQIQADGKILIAGTLNGQWYLQRLDRNGSLDNNFASNGTYRLAEDNGRDDRIYAIQIQADGKILIAGNLDDQWCVQRLNRDGSLDNNFAINGTYTPEELDGQELDEEADEIHAMQVQPDGKILIAGDVDSGQYLQRLHADGSLDDDFTRNVRNALAQLVENNYSIHAMQVQPNGKILIAGVGGYLYRLHADGFLDRDFATNGICFLEDPLGQNNSINMVQVQADGKILVAGDNGYLQRLHSNGSIDRGFARNGMYVLEDSRGQNRSINTVQIQANRKILIAGAGGYLQRLHENGSVDRDFAASGFSLSPSGGRDGNINEIYAMQVQKDGKILIAGHDNFKWYVQRLANDFGTIAEKRRYWIQELQRRTSRE
jgi:uncharacterized delta-60 repeat protein